MPIFYLQLSKVLLSWRSSYICNTFSHCLRTGSAPDRKQVQIIDSYLSSAKPSLKPMVPYDKPLTCYKIIQDPSSHVARYHLLIWILKRRNIDTINIYLSMVRQSRHEEQRQVIISHSLLWDVIIYACPRYMPLTPKSSFHEWIVYHASITEPLLELLEKYCQFCVILKTTDSLNKYQAIVCTDF